MKILAMDTSGPSLSVALLADGVLAYECVQQNGHTHSESLMLRIDEALRVAGLAATDIDCFAAVHGPGSFTGVRIGVTTARALAHATGRLCIGISALSALAHAVDMDLSDAVVCPMQDARAGQVYAAAYRSGRQIIADAAIPLDAFLAQLDKGVCHCFVGDGAARHREAIAEGFGGNARFVKEGRMAIHAGDVARLALINQEAMGDWHSLTPYYLRAPQAERERLAR